MIYGEKWGHFISSQNTRVYNQQWHKMQDICGVKARSPGGPGTSLGHQARHALTLGLTPTIGGLAHCCGPTWKPDGAGPVGSPHVRQPLRPCHGPDPYQPSCCQASEDQPWVQPLMP